MPRFCGNVTNASVGLSGNIYVYWEWIFNLLRGYNTVFLVCRFPSVSIAWQVVNRKLLGGGSRKGFGHTQRLEGGIQLTEKAAKGDGDTDTRMDAASSEWRSSVDNSEILDTWSIGTHETYSELEDDLYPNEVSGDNVSLCMGD